MIDLHAHSNASDGGCSPEELAELGASIGLTALAVTDHDTVGGVAGFLERAKRFPGMAAVPGVELSTVFGARELHIVGLFIDPESPELLTFLEEMRRIRQERNERIFRRLDSLGYRISWEDPAFQSTGDTASLGRPHFARALMERYGFPSLQAVFDKLLKFGAPAYVPRRLPDPVRAIDAIHHAGGVAIWAHPVYRQRNERAWARRIMKRFAPLGLDGVEGYYSMFGPPETALVTELAAEYGLLLSGGSDFHGANQPEIRLGAGMGKLCVPDGLFAPLRERAERYR